MTYYVENLSHYFSADHYKTVTECAGPIIENRRQTNFLIIIYSSKRIKYETVTEKQYQ